MTTFRYNQDVWFQDKRFVVVRGTPDADGDIVVKDPNTYLEQYLPSAKCKYAHAPKPLPSLFEEAPTAYCGGGASSPKTHLTPEPVAQPTPIEGNQTMSNAQNTSRRVVSVTLIDRDVNLEGKEAIVLELGRQVTEGSNQELIQELIMDPANKVAEAMKAHNDKRANVVNREVLNRTGNKVKLEAVKMRELHWDIV